MTNPVSLLRQVEAKDNVKFLQTLERHFKNLENGSLQTIVETLPSLLNAIRMVWIISHNPLHFDMIEQCVQQVKCHKRMQGTYSSTF